MDKNIEVVFDNIEQRILEEIKNARYAIFVSVAWFTNKTLFQALHEKAKDNCYVSIIIQMDDINSQCGIDFNQIQVGRSECFIISKEAELLHDKFCVIDFKQVITGSYNWTYKASYNSENVVIISDPNIATQYITRFEQQKSKYNDINIQCETPSQITSNKSTAISTTPKTIGTNSSTPIIPNSTRKCFHCLHELYHNDAYCQYCGTLQNDAKKITRRIIKCKICGHEQKKTLLDIAKTHYCTNCGNKLFNAKGAIFRLPGSCPICKSLPVEGWNYCSKCGLKKFVSHYELEKFKEYQLCPKCNTPNYFETKYCRNCGQDISNQAKDSNGHGWIDLGLSVLWSTETMEDFYPWKDCRTKLTLYSDFLDLNYKGDERDVASEKWGDKWRVPTKEEFEELINRCNWEKVLIPLTKKHALKVTGPNGNHILLPVTGYAGCCKKIAGFSNKEYTYNECAFWTSSRSTNKHKLSNKFAYAFKYYGYSNFSPTLTARQKKEADFEFENRFGHIHSHLTQGTPYPSAEEQVLKWREQKKALNEMPDDSLERRKNEDLDMERRHELWLNTPISNIGSNTQKATVPRLFTMPINSGYAIRPVADKKWKGKI